MPRRTNEDAPRPMNMAPPERNMNIASNAMASALQPLFGVCDFQGATLHFHFGQ